MDAGGGGRVIRMPLANYCPQTLCNNHGMNGDPVLLDIYIYKYSAAAAIKFHNLISINLIVWKGNGNIRWYLDVGDAVAIRSIYPNSNICNGKMSFVWEGGHDMWLIFFFTLSCKIIEPPKQSAPIMQCLSPVQIDAHFPYRWSLTIATKFTIKLIKSNHKSLFRM